ncbi:restriction endonuclease subunit S [Lysobacter sp. N42]|uniref:restriction endonuclease subunit S n=1 Tax=Lysobacter sp. N42 TaxID=2545719 RepID=UPI00104E812B|nr:restriction endonuclease subunit S [Lysobacter sp. N42]TCZ85028.1 restriction endonuclease subunit S [Lysobacter sp. N42]
MSSWTFVPMGQLCSIQSGKSDTKDAVPDGPYAFFDRSKTIKRSSRFIHDCEALIIPGEGAEFLPRHFIGKFDLHQRAYALFNFAPEIDVKFLFHYLHYVADYFPRVAVGATVKSLRLRHFQELPVAVTEREEQQRIVAILDEAFAGIATAKANAEANLQDAEATRVAFLRSVFDHRGSALATGASASMSSGVAAAERDSDLAAGVTRTGGRAAALRHIPGDFSLSVGMPARGARPGWRWVELAQLARLESGHTPSRRHPEYWGGDIPWLSIRDAREHHGGYVADTEEKTNALGIANSSARVLPAGTVCLSRTASIGYVTVTRNAMATSQDFVNWVCSPDLSPEFLKYVFLAEGRDGLLRFASGAVHQTIYFPEAKAFHICCPDRSEQDRVVARCDAVTAEARRLAGVYQRKLAALDELKQSLLHRAFSGQL